MIKAIYKVGSSCILPNPHDIDYVYYYETEEEAQQAFREHDIEENKNIHFCSIQNAKKVRLGCYSYPFCEHIEGEDLHLDTFSIFDVKDEYIAYIKKTITFLKRTSKRWYHIYIAVRMFEKGEMKLTKKEKQTAQKIHDEGIDEKLYQYIIDYIEK